PIAADRLNPARVHQWLAGAVRQGQQCVDTASLLTREILHFSERSTRVFVVSKCKLGEFAQEDQLVAIRKIGILQRRGESDERLHGRRREMDWDAFPP